MRTFVVTRWIAVSLVAALLPLGAEVYAARVVNVPEKSHVKKKPAARARIKAHAEARTKPEPAASKSQKQPPTAQQQKQPSPLAPAPPAGPQPPATTQAQPPPPTQAQPPGLKPLGLKRNLPEELGQVPDHFFWLRSGLQAVQDPLDGQLVFLDDDGRIVGRATLPAGFVIGQAVQAANAVRLIDVTGHKQMSIARNLDSGAIRSLQAIPVMPDGATRAGLVTRRGAQQLMLRSEERANERPLDVRSLTGAPLAQAYEIGPAAGDNRFVVSEEIVATVPRLQVRVFVRRYNRNGELTGLIHVPLDGMEMVPHDFITVTGTGVVRVLVPTAGGVTIRDYEFGAPPRGRRLREQDLKNLGRTLREIPVPSAVTGETHYRFRSLEAPHLEVTAAAPPVSRENILANARAYLTVNWVMQAENFSKPGIENACTPQQGYIWLRPRHFSKELIGTTIGPMPYRWGGDDTPNTFRIRTEWGALAGNLCTCRDAELNYCIFADSAGIDCSGLVSRAWGIEKRGTAGLLDVADEVKDLTELKPGDAFDWPERHVRLFTGMAPGAETAFTVLESSTRFDCEGVCVATYRPSELNGYRIIRYRGASDTAVASNAGGANVTAPPPAAMPAPPAAAPAPAPAAPANAGQNNAAPPAATAAVTDQAKKLKRVKKRRVRR